MTPAAPARKTVLDIDERLAGSWQLAVGSWQLAVGSWQLAVQASSHG